MKVGSDVQLDAVSTTHGGVRLTGTDIVGQLSFHGAQLNGTDNEDNALYADSVTVGGRVIIDGGFTAAGTVRLPGANITGRLRFHDAELNGKDKNDCALLADQMTVGGGMTLDGVRTTGFIRMANADITGDLHCNDIRLEGTDRDRNALVADSVTIGGRLILYHVHTEGGAVRLPGANITGRLQLGDARLNGKDNNGLALLADGMTVGSGVWLGGVRTTQGAIRIVGADITGDLHCNGVRLKGIDGQDRALVADRIKLSGSVFFVSGKSPYSEPGSIAEGAVSLRSANIGGSLKLEPEKLAEGIGSSTAAANGGLTCRDGVVNRAVCAQLTFDPGGKRAPASGSNCQDRARPRYGHRLSSASFEIGCYAEFLV